MTCTCHLPAQAFGIQQPLSGLLFSSLCLPIQHERFTFGKNFIRPSCGMKSGILSKNSIRLMSAKMGIGSAGAL